MKAKAEKQLIADLKKVAEKKAKELGKNLAWFKFAKKGKYGYRFLANKEAQWRVLEEIAKGVSVNYPQYSKGQVVDFLCALVNS